MVLFYAAIRRNSVSLLRFPFLSHVQVFSSEISLDCRLKYLYTCFSSHFLFSVYFCSVEDCVVCIVFGDSHPYSAVVVVSMLASFLPPSCLYLYSLSTSSLGCKVLCIIKSFLVLWSICWNSSLVYFKNGPEYLSRGTAQIFIHLVRFLLCSLVSRSFPVLL